MKRPIGVTIIAALTFFGAAALALGSFAFFVVAVMGMTGGDARDPASVAIAGMGVAGGFWICANGRGSYPSHPLPRGLDARFSAFSLLGDMW